MFVSNFVMTLLGGKVEAPAVESPAPPPEPPAPAGPRRAWPVKEHAITAGVTFALTSGLFYLLLSLGLLH